MIWRKTDRQTCMCQRGRRGNGTSSAVLYSWHKQRSVHGISSAPCVASAALYAWHMTCTHTHTHTHTHTTRLGEKTPEKHTNLDKNTHTPASWPEAFAFSNSACSTGGRAISPFTSFRLMVLFHRFLIALSVRPGSAFAISAHRFPLLCKRCVVQFTVASAGPSDGGGRKIKGTSSGLHRQSNSVKIKLGRAGPRALIPHRRREPVMNAAARRPLCRRATSNFEMRLMQMSFSSAAERPTFFQSTTDFSYFISLCLVRSHSLTRCASTSLRSSSFVQASLLMSGLRWLCQRSRHCFPLRPGSTSAMRAHCFVP